ncbi:hypothetical protein [Gorillibacterium massiliense]|uniref:hypothetical protein n=1 Tax=Gorillibacterium massiliense TaxID=1280390 RepID=UPI0004B8A553|nr:hypothetical protein [Gorillibacterium massiliense]
MENELLWQIVIGSLGLYYAMQINKKAMLNIESTSLLPSQVDQSVVLIETSKSKEEVKR